MIRRAREEDIMEVAAMASSLFEGSKVEELYEEFSYMIDSGKSHLFVYYKDNKAVGFAHCEIRIDYVAGSENSPVMFLEGIYVHPEYRHLGLGKKLVEYAEDQTRKLGLSEFASDCELGDTTVYDFHLKSGFKEVERTVSFIKKL